MYAYKIILKICCTITLYSFNYVCEKAIVNHLLGSFTA